MSDERSSPAWSTARRLTEAFVSLLRVVVNHRRDDTVEEAIDKFTEELCRAIREEITYPALRAGNVVRIDQGEFEIQTVATDEREAIVHLTRSDRDSSREEVVAQQNPP